MDNIHSPLVFCFDNASTVIAMGSVKKIKLFDLATKKVIARVPLKTAVPLRISFNHNNSRLVYCAGHESGIDKHTIFIWDTINFTDIKLLQSNIIDTGACKKANITFSDSNIIAVSTDNTTMFFETQTGRFLSKTVEIASKQDADAHGYVATVPLYRSPITCIGMNKGDNSSYINIYDPISGDCINTVSYDLPFMNGIGVTNDNKCLVATFDNGKAITSKLGSDLLHDLIENIASCLEIVSLYALLQLHRAKQTKKEKPNLSQQVYQYIKEDFSPDEACKELLKKYYNFDGAYDAKKTD